MFKKVLSIVLGLIISGAMMISPLLYSPAYAASEDEQLNIDDAKYYYVTNYKSGDCVLCSNAYMIMRAAFAGDSRFFDLIINKKLRKHACTTSTGNILKHEYDFTYDGLTFKIKYKKLSGDYKERKKKIKSMLDKHPEGIVGLGRSSYGSHGVLLTGYEGNTFYACDSAKNYGGFNKGITPYSETIMKSMSTIKHVWYIDEVKGSSTSAHVEEMKLSIKAKKDGSKWKLTWSKRGDDTKLSGFKLSYLGKKAYDRGENFKSILKTKLHTATIDDKENGKSYYYRVRGYLSDGKKSVYTKTAKVLITMSDPDE